MNWTTAHLAALDEAIATGALRVRFQDGREVTYRSLSDMMAVRDRIAAALGVDGDAGQRVTFAEFTRD